MDMMTILAKREEFHKLNNVPAREVRLNRQDMKELVKPLALMFSGPTELSAAYKNGFIERHDGCDFFIDDSIPVGEIRLA